MQGRRVKMVLLAALMGALTAAAAAAQVKAAPAPPVVSAAFDVTAATVEELELPLRAGRPFHVDVVLRGGPKTLRLTPYEVRAPGFRLYVDDGRALREVPSPPAVTYRGLVVGDPKSLVAVSLVAGQLRGIVRLGDGSLWGIEPLRTVDPRALRAAHLVFAAANNIVLPVRCGNTEMARSELPSLRGGAVDAGGVKVAEIAIDADYPFYQLNGRSVTATQNDVTTIMNGVAAIYKRDVQIDYKITAIVVRTNGDPYTTTSPSGLLSQFAGYWNANHGGITRDLAHLFTGRNLAGSVIGIATLGTVCNIRAAYGLSQSRFTSNTTYRIGLTAHEIGHNWNARHCNAYSPCYIMCSGLGGCSRSVTRFAPVSISTITAFRNTRTCLSAPPPPTPVLTSLSPRSVQALNGGTVTLTGRNLDTATKVYVGPVVLDRSGFRIVSSTKITFAAPIPPVLGNATVVVENPSGKSNGLVLTYVKTNPPLLVAPLIGLGGQPFTWTYGADPSDFYFLLISFNDKSTFQYQGWTVLKNFLVLTLGNLDLAGIGKLTLPIPKGPLAGQSVYSQVVFLDEKTFAFAGATNIVGTLFLTD